MVCRIAVLTVLLMSGMAWADTVLCSPQPADVIMATPFSSRIDRVGDTLQAVLIHALPLTDGATLPAGTMLTGKVTAIRPQSMERAGSIQIRFTHAAAADAGSPLSVDAVPATGDGWLHQADADTPVWHVSLTRSTRLLNLMIQRRLGTNRAAWAQILGIRENVIPDPTTDEFIRNYNRHDVLVGAGDRLQLQLRCGNP